MAPTLRKRLLFTIGPAVQQRRLPYDTLVTFLVVEEEYKFGKDERALQLNNISEWDSANDIPSCVPSLKDKRNIHSIQVSEMRPCHIIIRESSFFQVSGR